MRVVKPRDPMDGLYLAARHNDITLNGERIWDTGGVYRRWAEWQGKPSEIHYHYEHNVLVLPKEYLT